MGPVLASLTPSTFLFEASVASQEGERSCLCVRGNDFVVVSTICQLDLELFRQCGGGFFLSLSRQYFSSIAVFNQLYRGLQYYWWIAGENHRELPQVNRNHYCIDVVSNSNI